MSRAVLDEHRRVWRDKPVLAEVYGVWFRRLYGEVPPGGRAVEIGAGPGFLRTHVRADRPDVRWLSTDILPVPWNDLAADGLRLPFREAAADALVGLDMLHHLARPARFFEEAARVLKDGGRLAVVEPWVTPLSYPIYRFLHQEGCNLGLDPWNPFALGPEGGKDAFDGDAAVVYRLLRAADRRRWQEIGFSSPRVQPLNGFAYILSLGFKPRSLLPRVAARSVLALDELLRPLAPGLGMRALVTWTRRSRSAAARDAADD